MKPSQVVSEDFCKGCPIFSDTKENMIKYNICHKRDTKGIGCPRIEGRDEAEEYGWL